MYPTIFEEVHLTSCGDDFANFAIIDVHYLEIVLNLIRYRNIFSEFVINFFYA